jgi:high-affinity nickel-transport protein
MVDVWTLVLVSIPAMIALGVRHALDVDHITAIDNLVRLHNAQKKSRWVGTGFSSGHMLSVLAEMVFIIYIIADINGAGGLQLWGSVIGAIALGVIGSMNIFSMKRYGKTSPAIFASKVLSRTGMIGPFGSALVTGLVFGLGFDTATQISALTLSAIASATAGVQVALVLAGFFALGMIPTDTLDSILLRSAFHRIFNSQGFRHMSYALSGSALTVAGLESYSTITGVNILPEWFGMALAISIIAASFGYAFAMRNKGREKVVHEHRHQHGDGNSYSHIHTHQHAFEQEHDHEHEHKYEHDMDVKEKANNSNRDSGTSSEGR